MIAASQVDFAAKDVSTHSNGVSMPWGPAEPFDALDVPDFPSAVLSPWLGAWARAVAEFCQVPLDLPCAVALSTLSLAVCRRFQVRVVPGWEEPCNLYTAVALPPAERKSPVFAKATAPLHTYQRELADELAPRIARRETERRILAGQIASAEAAAIKGKPYEGGDARQAALELAAQLTALPALHIPGLVADDVTPEALAVLLGQSEERVGIFSAEGGPFEMMAGRYSDKGHNFEIYLKAHPGDAHTVNRIRREPVTLAHPLIAIALTIQPAVIQGLASKEGFRGLGLLARFLYSLPRSLVGHRAVEAPEVPADVERRYHQAVGALLRLGNGERVLTLSPEAHAARCAFARALEPRLGDDGDLEQIRDWAGKLVGTVCRLAAILHVADYADDLEATPTAIGADVFARAVTVGEYFLGHALAAFSVMGADDATELAKRLWGWTQRTSVKEFSEREAQRATHATAETIRPAIAKLCERHLVRELSSTAPVKGRPPSPRFEVRP